MATRREDDLLLTFPRESPRLELAVEGLASRVMLSWGWRRAMIAFLAGAAAVLVQAPFDFFAAGFVAFPLLVWLLDGVVASRPGPLRAQWPAFAVGWWFGFGYFLAGLWWIGTALLVEADSFAWALPLAVVGIPAMMAVYYGLAAVGARLLWSKGIGRIGALAVAFALAEWLRGFMFTGFPWNAIGYGAMPTPLAMQSVARIGMIGMNAVTVFVFAMPALLASRTHAAAGMFLAAGLITAHIGFGYYRLGQPLPLSGQSLVVRIVQPNIDLSEKWDETLRDRIFKTTMEVSARPTASGVPKPQLIVWPETAVPFLFTERPDALAAIGDWLGSDQMLITGAVRGEGNIDDPNEGRYTNAVLAIGGSGEIVDAVDKVHLVPFGEYIPFADWLGSMGLEQLVAGPTMFEAGSRRHAFQLSGGARVMPFICYEVIFPELVADAPAVADVILNATNDAWFGDTPGPYQHLRQAQVRAAETGLPVIRAANTGISAVIDGRGVIVDALAIGARGAIDFVIMLPAKLTSAFPAPRVCGWAVIGLLFTLAGVTWLLDRRPRM